jgi:micrococcal nuclease
MSVINETDRYVYDASVIRVVDGDTLDLLIDLGFRVFTKVRVRLFGVDTPETFGVKKESEEYKAGKAATAFVETWFTEREKVLVKSHDGKPLGQGKYGRWLAVVLPRDGGMSLNEALLKHGHAEKVSY